MNGTAKPKPRPSHSQAKTIVVIGETKDKLRFIYICGIYGWVKQIQNKIFPILERSMFFLFSITIFVFHSLFK